MRIAIDIGRLHGHRTGAGHAVAHIVDHLNTGRFCSSLIAPQFLLEEPAVALQRVNLPETASSRALDTAFNGAALATCATDATQREHLIAAGAANLNRFDWTHTVDSLVTLYNDAIEAGSRGPA